MSSGKVGLRLLSGKSLDSGRESLKEIKDAQNQTVGVHLSLSLQPRYSANFYIKII